MGSIWNLPHIWSLVGFQKPHYQQMSSLNPLIDTVSRWEETGWNKRAATLYEPRISRLTARPQLTVADWIVFLMPELGLQSRERSCCYRPDLCSLRQDPNEEWSRLAGNSSTGHQWRHGQGKYLDVLHVPTLGSTEAILRWFVRRLPLG